MLEPKMKNKSNHVDDFDTNLSINVRRYQSGLQLLTVMSPSPQMALPNHDLRFVTCSCKFKVMNVNKLEIIKSYRKHQIVPLKIVFIPTLSLTWKSQRS